MISTYILTISYTHMNKYTETSTHRYAHSPMHLFVFICSVACVCYSAYVNVSKPAYKEGHYMHKKTVLKYILF